MRDRISIPTREFEVLHVCLACDLHLFRALAASVFVAPQIRARRGDPLVIMATLQTHSVVPAMSATTLTRHSQLHVAYDVECCRCKTRYFLWRCDNCREKGPCRCIGFV
jgi:hypothetical protein